MKKKNPSLVSLAILTVITIVTWVALEVYRNIKKEPPLVVPKEVIAPFDPKLDINALSALSSRLEVNESEIPVIVETPTASPTALATLEPEISPTPEATSSATPSATPAIP